MHCKQNPSAPNCAERGTRILAWPLAFWMLAPLFAQTTPPSVITTVAGAGIAGHDGNTGQPAGGPIRFAGISSITRDSSGNWYVADYANSRIRKLSPDFSVATTVAGTGGFYLAPTVVRASEAVVDFPVALAFAGGERLFYVQTSSAFGVLDLARDDFTTKMQGDRLTDGPALDAMGAYGTSIAVHPDGRVFLANILTRTVRVFDPATNTVRNLTPAQPSLFRGGLHVVMDRNRVLYAVDGEAFTVSRIDLTSGAASLFLSFRDLGIRQVTNVVEGPDSTLFVADAESQKVFRLNLTVIGAAAVQPVAGTGVQGVSGVGGPALAAQLAGPQGLYWDRASETLYIGETQGSRMLSVDSSGVLRMVLGSAIPGFSGDDKPGPATATQSRLDQISALTADDAGNLYACETNRIRRFTPGTGAITLVAGHKLFGGLSTGLAVESFVGLCNSFAYDPSTRALFYIDRDLIRRLDTVAGTISTVSTMTFRGLGGIAPLRGNLVVADTVRHRLQMVTPQGAVTSLAGTGASTGGNPLMDAPAATAILPGPGQLAVAADGTIFFTSDNNAVIRALGADGIVRHIAGSTRNQNGGDGGPAKQATFANIGRLAVDARKRVYVATGNMIRMIDEQGIVTRFAGSETAGFAGDGGNPLGALFRIVGGIAHDASGAMFVADRVNVRIRRIGPAAVATRFSIVSGNGQAVDSGAQSGPLTVEVRDASGQPVAGTAVNFRAENGTLSANTATTGANGTASVLVRAGSTLGPIRVFATSGSLGQLAFELRAIAALSVKALVSSVDPETKLAPGSLARVTLENGRGAVAPIVSFNTTAGEVLEGSAASGSLLVAIPDALDAGPADVVATEPGRTPSAPLPITLEATAPAILGCETAEGILACRVTGYGKSLDGIPVASSSSTIDGVESEIVEFRTKSPGVAEMRIGVPADFASAGAQERTVVLRIGAGETAAKVTVGQ